jgi:flagella basal body P-ring formation protein FlgA
MMPRFASLLYRLGGLAGACAVAAPALAGQTVNLNPVLVDATGQVTLGELFDDAGAARDVVVAQRIGPSVVLDAASVQAFARRYGLDWANPRGVLRIIVRAGESSGPVAGRNLEILTYARDINPGEVVQPQDLVWARSAAAPQDAPRDADAVIGQAARRPLRQGDAVAARDLSPPVVIKTGDMVTVVYANDGITLTLQGKAMAGAALGDSFSVLNPASHKTIEAVASGPDQALVGPEADRLKASRDPSQIALR